MAIPKGKPRRPNASLSFEGNRKYLWVYTLDQEIGMSGKTAQSRFTKRFYARHFKEEPMMIKGRCASMADQTRLSLFIRLHQRRMVSESPHWFKKNDSLLMKFSMPLEGIVLRGAVETFEIQKKGHKDPAPEFSISFSIYYDFRLADKDPRISFTVVDLAKSIENAQTPQEIGDTGLPEGPEDLPQPDRRPEGIP